MNRKEIDDIITNAIDYFFAKRFRHLAIAIAIAMYLGMSALVVMMAIVIFLR